MLREYRGAVLLGVGCALWCIFNVHFAFGLLQFLSGIPIFFSYLSYGQKSGFISAATKSGISEVLKKILEIKKSREEEQQSETESEI